jgi:PAS domain S-box-containing protein
MDWQQLIDNLTDFAIYKVDPAGKVQTWSKAAERLLGYSADQIIGQSVKKLVPVGTSESGLCTAALEEAVRKGRCEFLGWVVRRDGSRFWANEVTTQLLDEAGRLEGFAKVMRDFTQWKDAADERDRIFNMSADMICVAGFDRYFKRVNPSFTRVLGYSEAELIGKPYTDFIHPDDRMATVSEAKSLEGQPRDSSKPFQNRYLCADGTYRWLEWKSISLPEEELVYAIARDVTEQKANEEKLRAIAVELERSNTELQQFAYVASHDLQEPLRAVVGCVQMLAERIPDQMDDRSKELIHFATDGAKRMQSLINDLLAYSRVGNKGITREMIDPGVAAKVALRQLQMAVAESKAVITVDPMPQVSADQTQLTQLFQNLIGNAIKFHGERDPAIHVKAIQSNGDLVFCVSDNGIGIAKEYYDRVFGVFQRLHTRREYPGSGIGLAICKKIVERHEGRIWIESKPGEGATFYFTLTKGHHVK